MDVRVGTWNLENLFRPGGEFGPGDAAIYRQKLDGLAATIEKMAPDILGVEEVGSPDAPQRPDRSAHRRVARRAVAALRRPPSDQLSPAGVAPAASVLTMRVSEPGSVATRSTVGRQKQSRCVALRINC